MITVMSDEFKQGLARHIWPAGTQISIFYNSADEARIDLDVIQYITSMTNRRVKVSYEPNSVLIQVTL